YSLGGRFALSLVERCPELWSTVLLAAPDGLVRAPWYRGLANHRWGRWAYRCFIRRPGGIHALIDLLHRTGIIGAPLHRFLIGQSDTREARELLHDVWTTFRMIEPDLVRVAANLRSMHLPLHLYLGKHDQVIKPAQARRLSRLATQQVHVHTLQSGHWMLSTELGKAIARALPGHSRKRPLMKLR